MSVADDPLEGLARTTLHNPMLRAVPSRYPPVQTFDSVTTPEDLAAVMEQ